MSNLNNQLNRMKAMMTYGLNESQVKKPYSGIEFHKLGADGKRYGIVREGAKYYIKVADKNTSVLKEDYQYIGGFRNRKDYEYSNYASALKNFEMKLNSLKEAHNNQGEVLIGSWDLEKKEMLAVESVDNMQKEINRQRQIMYNSSLIQEKKNYEAKTTNYTKVNKEIAANEKNNIKTVADGMGDAASQSEPFMKKAPSKQAKSQGTNVKGNFKPVMESEETLAWNDNEDYMDTSKSTEIGDSKPFDKCACTNEVCVEEEIALHSTDNQNQPTVGVGEVGDDAPFNEKPINEEEELDGDEDNFDDNIDIDSDDEIDDYSDDDVDIDVDDDMDIDTDNDYSDDDVDDDIEDNDINERLDTIEDLIYKIADKLNIDNFTDDSLYDSDDDMTDDYSDDDMTDDYSDDDMTDDYSDDDMDDDYSDDDMDDDYSDDETDDEYEVFESKNYVRLMKESNEKDFGKHPAYQKAPMKTPSSKHQEFEGYYDMNDESAQNEKPFGMEVGDGEPFMVDVEALEDAITESIKNLLKKKI